MNNYIRELVEICKLPFNEVINDYKIIQLGSKVIYVSNFIKIVDYSSERIVLKVKNNLIEIKGIDLKIKQLNKSEILLKGSIHSCSLEMVND